MGGLSYFFYRLIFRVDVCLAVCYPIDNRTQTDI